MSSNAATLLVELIDSYAVPPNHKAQTAFGFDNAHDIDAWREHIEALTLVRNVDDAIRDMAAQGDPVDIFVPSVPHWYAGVGMASTPWGSTHATERAICPPEHRKMLKALALLIDAQGRSLDITEADRRALSDVLDEAAELLEASQTMPPSARSYLRALIDRARFLLEALDTYGAESVRAVVLELGGAMVMEGGRASAEGDQPTAKRWWSSAHLLVAGFLGGMGSEGASAITTGISAVAKQLG
ncbi:hypothetical protein QWJ41_14840 [Nocardioides sp. SOB44]|uniref:Uncharacterized protein n=1 Tax=Nocardioides cremeus TaxID=3058044 RepID=A0ABT8TT53_9ACTN|nr:hypothetical protein [Nocardioides cremeus]MDO3397001.1 hypothetical protein [Nocardioides cremeus]